MDTVSFIDYIKTEDIYSDITKDDETRFDTSNQTDHYLNEKIKINLIIERRIMQENNETVYRFETNKIQLLNVRQQRK